MENKPQTIARRKERMSYRTAFDLNGNTPPQALDLEEAVLGALMLNSNALNATIETLHREYFYKPENQYIFDAIHKLFSESYPVDLLTVVERLRNDGTLEAAGGAYYVTQLTNNVVSGAHIEFHVRVLSEKFIQRELIRISTETITESYDPTTDVVSLLDITEQRLMDINDKNFRSDYKSLGTLVGEAIKMIDESQNSEEGVSGQPTGFVELDRMTSGFQPGTLIILAARPAMGKTAFALCMARNIAVEFNKPVAFFSLEMTGVELAMRLISSETSIESGKLKKGERLNDYEQQQLAEKSQTLNEAPLFIDDTPQLTIFELRAKCRRLKQQHPDLAMIFIDYLQLMQGSGDNRNGNREQEISTISRQLKALSKELKVPILALSQLSRAVETRGGDKRPQLSDLRESGAIEQDADIVMFIYRPEYYKIDQYEDGTPTAGMADVILAKHRSGGTGDVHMRFIGKYTRFENREEANIGTTSFSMGLPQNAEFDAATGAVVIDSKMNDDVPIDPDPDDQMPF